MDKNGLTMFRELETRLHKKEVRNSTQQVSELLADDFIEFGGLGVIYDKKKILDELKNEQFDLRIEITDFDARYVVPDVVLVTYRSSMIDENKRTQIFSLRSSLWVYRDERWLMAFHQGTRV